MASHILLNSASAGIFKVMSLLSDNDVLNRLEISLNIWGIKDPELIGSSRLAHVWRVNGNEGFRVIKIYKGRNMGSERFAVQFLRQVDPKICVEVYQVDEENRAILMEWLPGKTLSELSEHQPHYAADIVVNLAEEIRNVNFIGLDGIKRVDDRLSKVDNAKILPTCEKRLAYDFSRARDILGYLRSTSGDYRIIHGDLRFDNIIVSSAGPKIIDPKVQLGETAFEIAHVLWHGMGDSGEPSLIVERAERYAERVGTSPKRLLQWAAVKLALYIAFQSRGTITVERRSPILSHLINLSET